MDLIEQLGGYERAKHEFEMIKEMKPIYSDEIETNNRLLLEYRRQHNIFEVGDIAVKIRGDESRLLKIWRVNICSYDNRISIADYDASGLAGWSRFHCLRHATDEEIEVGKRLSHN